jgi:hypothetical protein
MHLKLYLLALCFATCVSGVAGDSKHDSYEKSIEVASSSLEISLKNSNEFRGVSGAELEFINYWELFKTQTDAAKNYITHAHNQSPNSTVILILGASMYDHDHFYFPTNDGCKPIIIYLDNVFHR